LAEAYCNIQSTADTQSHFHHMYHLQALSQATPIAIFSLHSLFLFSLSTPVEPSPLYFFKPMTFSLFL
jgi:hypothetical protein